METSTIREQAIILHSIPPYMIDKEYNLYYDETGNCRIFRIKGCFFNVYPLSFFVLGGIVGNIDMSFQEVKDRLQLDKSCNEIKAKNIFRKDFQKCLSSLQLSHYLDLIMEQGLLFHFSSTNLLYFSIVDIIDSIMNPAPDVFLLKEELYNILKNKVDATCELMIKHDYPNINHDEQESFLTSLVEMLDTFIVDTGKATDLTYKLRFILLSAIHKDSLPFIQDEESGTLIKDFLMFYAQPLYMLKKSKHIFDSELEIEEKIEGLALEVENEKLRNYSFEDSKDNIMLQLSDVFVGLMSKYFMFVENNLPLLNELIAQFSSTQKNNLCKLNYLLNLSVEENKLFWHMSMPQKQIIAFSNIVDSYCL